MFHELGQACELCRPCAGRTAELDRLAIEMFARGLSTRDIEAAFRDDTGGQRVEPHPVSQVTERLWQEYEAFAPRDLSEFQQPSPTKVPMRLIGLAVVLALSCAFATLTAEAQQGGKWRIGFLGGGSESSFASLLDVLRQGLRDRGYVEGQNVAFEYRYADGLYERLPRLAAELVHSKVDVIVTEGTPPTLAAKGATKTIPIVMAHIGDAVATGVVTSLARPGGNVTGSSILLPELSAKRLVILKEAVPRIARVAVLSNGANPFHLHPMKPLDSAAHALGLTLEQVRVQDIQGIPVVLSPILTRTSAPVDALLVLDDPMFRDHEREIAEQARRSKLPSIFGIGVQATAGGLINFGPNRHAMYGRTALFIDRIFKGAKPADLPVEQPTKFDLIINLRTAKALGLTIPQSILLRADHVTE